MEIFYKINYDMINNYKKENINYQILKNINEIKNNIKIKNIDEIINENNINNIFKYLLDLFQKMRKKENFDNNNKNEKIGIDNIEQKDNNNITINDNINEIKLNKKRELNDEIKIIYEMSSYIKIFGKEFVEKSRLKCKIFYENKLNDLTYVTMPFQSSIDKSKIF